MHLNETGCCPVCDRQVPRVQTELEGGLTEIYDCPEDGPIGYGALPVTVERWARSIAGVAG